MYELSGLNDSFFKTIMSLASCSLLKCCQFTNTGGIWHRIFFGGGVKKLMIGLPSMGVQVCMKKMNIDSKHKWKILFMRGIVNV